MIWQTTVHWKCRLTKSNLSEWQHIVKIDGFRQKSKSTSITRSSATCAHKMLISLLTLKHFVDWMCWSSATVLDRQEDKWFPTAHHHIASWSRLRGWRRWHLRPVSGILSYLTFSSARPEQVKVYSSPVTCTHLLCTKAKDRQRKGWYIAMGQMWSPRVQTY